jgi:hypothetical protein
VQTIIGIEPHIMVIGMPQFIIFVIMSQHILSMSMLIMPIGIIMQVIPCFDISQVIDGIIAMPQQLIIGMPAHVIMQDMPLDIIDVSIVHMSFIMSIVVPSPGSIVHIIPLSVMAQVMRQFIGIIIAIGMDGMEPMFIGIVFIIALMEISGRRGERPVSTRDSLPVT